MSQVKIILFKNLKFMPTIVDIKKGFKYFSKNFINKLFYNYEKKAINVFAIVLFVLVVFMSIMGYFEALGVLNTQ